MHKIFISYSRRDKYNIAAYLAILEAADVSMFVDVHSISPGDNWRIEIDNALKSTDRVLLFWSKHSAKSVQVKREIEIALNLGKTIVPMLLDSTPLSYEFKYIQYKDLRSDWVRFCNKISSVIPSLLPKKEMSVAELVERTRMEIASMHGMSLEDFRIFVELGGDLLEIV